jgi:hypothetical protein
LCDAGQHSLQAVLREHVDFVVGGCSNWNIATIVCWLCDASAAHLWAAVDVCEAHYARVVYAYLLFSVHRLVGVVTRLCDDSRGWGLLMCASELTKLRFCRRLLERIRTFLLQVL